MLTHAFRKFFIKHRGRCPLKLLAFLIVFLLFTALCDVNVVITTEGIL